MERKRNEYFDCFLNVKKIFFFCFVLKQFYIRFKRQLNRNFDYENDSQIKHGNENGNVIRTLNMLNFQFHVKI